MDTTTFTDGLNALFTTRLHKDLTARKISQRDDGWLLTIDGKTVNAMQDFHQAIRDDEVCSYLASWSEGDLFVFVQGLGWTKPIASAVVQQGSLLLVSGSTAGAAQADTAASSSCSEWFEQLIGAPPPIPLELKQIAKNLWGSPEVRHKEIVGFPAIMSIADSTSYTLACFDGYGCNSYAFYFSRVSDKTQLFLRLAWGGVYMNPESKRPYLLWSLEEANSLFETALAKNLPMVLRHSMGVWYFARDDAEKPQSTWDLDVVRAYVKG